ncbi:hypothetical protein GALL_367010 [mine drainage metagenome]|uniref:NAD-specific glutamate dehydrogenase n=1 Tax=mine drainage metagenome TaxID=410659 RepID=A0A1J5QVL7_9ZZZZ
MADLGTQGAQRFVDHLDLVGTEEHQVAVLCARAFDDGLQGGGMDILDDRALQAGLVELAGIVDLDVGQALGAVDLDEFGTGIDFAAAHGRATRHAQGSDAAAVHVGGGGEHLEIDILHHVGQFGDFKRHPHVRLVGAVAVHGFGERHARERIGQVYVLHLLEHLADHVLDDIHDLVFAEEGGLDVDLGEFRLTVGAQIFVAEALGDLEILVEAGHHQQLFEQLRRLRQSEEHAVVHARRHQVIARALRGGTGQHRGFDFDETGSIEVVAHGLGHAVAQHQVLLHGRAAQVQIAMLEAHRLGQVVVIEHERRGERRVQDLDFRCQHFDFTGRNVAVDRALWARAHLAGDLQHEFVAHGLGQCKGGLGIRVDHDLRNAGTVAQVDENDAAVVAAAMGPTAQGYDLADMLTVEFAAVMSTHNESGLIFWLRLSWISRRRRYRPAAAFPQARQRPWR